MMETPQELENRRKRPARSAGPVLAQLDHARHLMPDIKMICHPDQRPSAIADGRSRRTCGRFVPNEMRDVRLGDGL